MTLEQDLFRFLRPDRDALVRYGFTEENGEYWYRAVLIPQEFAAVFRTDEHGAVQGQVLDLFSGEEFIPVRLPGQTGPYVTRVKEAYLRFLEDIAEACFYRVDFAGEQANRIAGWIRNTFGDGPEHPFENDTESTVFRNPADRKWYALFLHIPYEKVCAKEGSTDIVNVKVDAEQLPCILETDGIFPAWHMNRKHWVTILLDDTVPDDTVRSLITKSHSFTGSRSAAPSASEAWVIPSNPNMWDIIGAMKRSDDLVWKQHSGVKQGDTLYIYVGAPYSAILYEYTVTDTDIPASWDFGPRYPYEMHLHCTYRFGGEDIPFARMKECGVRAVRGPRRITAELAAAIRSVKAH